MKGKTKKSFFYLKFNMLTYFFLILQETCCCIMLIDFSKKGGWQNWCDVIQIKGGCYDLSQTFRWKLTKISVGAKNLLLWKFFRLSFATYLLSSKAYFRINVSSCRLNQIWTTNNYSWSYIFIYLISSRLEVAFSYTWYPLNWK